MSTGVLTEAGELARPAIGGDEQIGVERAGILPHREPNPLRGSAVTRAQNSFAARSRVAKVATGALILLSSMFLVPSVRAQTDQPEQEQVLPGGGIPGMALDAEVTEFPAVLLDSGATEGSAGSDRLGGLDKPPVEVVAAESNDEETSITPPLPLEQRPFESLTLKDVQLIDVSIPGTVQTRALIPRNDPKAPIGPWTVQATPEVQAIIQDAYNLLQHYPRRSDIDTLITGMRLMGISDSQNTEIVFDDVLGNNARFYVILPNWGYKMYDIAAELIQQAYETKQAQQGNFANRIQAIKYPSKSADWYKQQISYTQTRVDALTEVVDYYRSIGVREDIIRMYERDLRDLLAQRLSNLRTEQAASYATAPSS